MADGGIAALRRCFSHKPYVGLWNREPVASQASAGFKKHYCSSFCYAVFKRLLFRLKFGHFNGDAFLVVFFADQIICVIQFLLYTVIVFLRDAYLRGLLF